MITRVDILNKKTAIRIGKFRLLIAKIALNKLEGFMKNSKSVLLLLLLLSVTFSPALAADERSGKAEKFTPAGEPEFKKITERASVAEEQNRKVLSALSGTWDFTASLYAEAGVEPFRTEGKITNELVDDRFLSSNANGSLNVAGHDAPMKAQGLMGYDISKKAFSSVWVDTLNTGLMVGTGKYDEKEKTITETGRFTDPVDGVEKAFRSEIRFVDEANYKRTIFVTGKSGKETKLLEFDYTKKM